MASKEENHCVWCVDEYFGSGVAKAGQRNTSSAIRLMRVSLAGVPAVDFGGLVFNGLPFSNNTGFFVHLLSSHDN